MEKLVILNLIHLNSRPCKKILIPQYIFTTGLEMFLRYVSTGKEVKLSKYWCPTFQILKVKFSSSMWVNVEMATYSLLINI